MINSSLGMGGKLGNSVLKLESWKRLCFGSPHCPPPPPSTFLSENVAESSVVGSFLFFVFFTLMVFVAFVPTEI